MEASHETLEYCINTANVHAKENPKKFARNGLSKKEIVSISGLGLFIVSCSKLEDKEIMLIIKKHPHKFWQLKAMCKEYPNLIAELRAHGSAYVCKAIEDKRAVASAEDIKKD